MSFTMTNLPDDIEYLKALVLQHEAEKKQLASELEASRSKLDAFESEVDFLREQLRLLVHRRFGASSEKSSVNQLGLFNEAEETQASSVEELLAEEEAVHIEVPAHARKKPGRKPLPSWLEREEILHDLSDEEKVCAEGHALKEIGREVSEQLEFIPATAKVLRHVRVKYACPHCKASVKTAPMPPQPIPKSMASPGLLAHIVTSKYVDGLPLYRQESILQRAGIDIPRSTTSNWMIKAGTLVQPFINLMRDTLVAHDYVECDETRTQVLKEVGKRATSQSYMWVQRGEPNDTPLILYDYDPSRSGEVPKRLLEGFKGYLQVDGYEGYNAVCARAGVTRVGCWTHARRKFDEALKGQGKTKKGKPSTKASRARQGLALIRKLYAFEDQAKGMSREERWAFRQEHSKPWCDKIRKWLDESLPLIPPKSLTGKALSYLDTQWPHLIRFLEDGRLRLDTNLVENAIRPFAVGRKAWLFSDTVQGAEASANLYSLVETAKANGIEPYAYLKHIFTELPKATTLEEIETLLPFNIDRDQFPAYVKR